MKELVIEAKVEALDRVLAFVDELLEETACSMKTKMQIDVVVEEVYVNIASYAYAPGTGQVQIRAEVSEDPAMLTVIFADSGTPYNPLLREDPDVTLPAEEREVGGLGVYLTKKFMDEVTYDYRDHQNILTIKKRL